jgi:hypothetical protein
MHRLQILVHYGVVVAGKIKGNETVKQFPPFEKQMKKLG